MLWRVVLCVGWRVRSFVPVVVPCFVSGVCVCCLFLVLLPVVVVVVVVVVGIVLVVFQCVVVFRFLLCWGRCCSRRCFRVGVLCVVLRPSLFAMCSLFFVVCYVFCVLRSLLFVSWCVFFVLC